MQKLEKNLIYIKNSFNNLYAPYSGIIFCLVLGLVIAKYFESAIDFVFTPIEPMSLFDYVEGQHWVWKSMINRFMFKRPTIPSENWAIGADYSSFFFNMSNHGDPAKWFLYDKCHFLTTMSRIEYNLKGFILHHPSEGFINFRGRPCGLQPGDPVRVYLDKIYTYALHDMGGIWPTVVDDEWELMLLYKWHHNVLQLPFYWLGVWVLDPMIDFFVESTFQFLLNVTLLEDFVYRLSEDNRYSLFLCSTVKFAINIKNFFNYITCDFFLDDFYSFLYNFFFSGIIRIFYIYKSYSDFLHCDWNSIFCSFSIKNILYFFDYYFTEYILYNFSFLVFNFFALFKLNFFLSLDLGFIFLKIFFLTFFSHFFVIFLSYTVFSKYFWKKFSSFLNWINYIWFDIIGVVLIIFTLKIISILSFLPVAFWRFLLKKYLAKETVKKLTTFSRLGYIKYFQYKELMLDIYLREYLFRGL